MRKLRERRQLGGVNAPLDGGDALAMGELDQPLAAERLHDRGGDAADDRDDGDREDEERDDEVGVEDAEHV